MAPTENEFPNCLHCHLWDELCLWCDAVRPDGVSPGELATHLGMVFGQFVYQGGGDLGDISARAMQDFFDAARAMHAKLSKAEAEGRIVRRSGHMN